MPLFPSFGASSTAPLLHCFSMSSLSNNFLSTHISYPSMGYSYTVKKCVEIGSPNRDPLNRQFPYLKDLKGLYAWNSIGLTAHFEFIPFIPLLSVKSPLIPWKTLIISFTLTFGCLQVSFSLLTNDHQAVCRLSVLARNFETLINWELKEFQSLYFFVTGFFRSGSFETGLYVQ